MSGFKVGAEVDGWAESESEGETCTECKQLIIGKMFLGQIYIAFVDKTYTMKLCEPCYLEMKNESAAED